MPHTVARHTHGKFSVNCREVGVAGKNDERDDHPRHLLKCMAWAGTGAVWTMSSGILKGSPLGQSAGKGMMTHGGAALRFVQISDSHIGFDQPANTDVTGTLRAAIARIKQDLPMTGRVVVA